MKYITSTLLALMFVLAPQALAHAQNDSTTSTSTNTERPAQIRDVIRTFAPQQKINTDAEVKARMQAELRVNMMEREDDDHEPMEDRDRMELRAELRAEGTTTAEMKREEVRERQKEQLEKREERQEELAERTKERIHTFLERTLARFDAAIERLEDVADRIQSRIDKLDERDLDVSVAENLLAEARLNIGEASDAVLTAEIEIETALNSDNPREALAEIKTFFIEAREAIKDAHQSLIAVITELKQGTLKLEARSETNVDVDTGEDTDTDQE